MYAETSTSSTNTVVDAEAEIVRQLGRGVRCLSHLAVELDLHDPLLATADDRHLHGLAGEVVVRMATMREMPSLTGWSSTAVMTSSFSRPARSAGVSGMTSVMVAPLASGSPPVRTWAPMTGYSASPVRRIWSTVVRTCSMGIAKPTPMLPASPDAPPLVAIAEFTPTTSPARFTSGPPEFPGLIAASVCTALM